MAICRQLKICCLSYLGVAKRSGPLAFLPVDVFSTAQTIVLKNLLQ